MRIALDAMGGDKGPEALVAGAVQAVEELGLSVVLFGDEKILLHTLKNLNAQDDDRLEVVHAPEVIAMNEAPFDAIRKKRNASIVKAFAALGGNDIDAVVSAGNSGATMAAAVRSLGRLPDVSRPGIAGVYPTLKGQVIMMDVGANVDCRPQHLFQFGIMASAFSEVVFHTDNPRIEIGRAHV